MRLLGAITLLSVLIACGQPEQINSGLKQTFDFKTTSLRLQSIINWDGRIIITNNTGELLELKSGYITEFRQDSIVSIRKCKEGFFVLKAPNDTTLVIDQPNKKKIAIKNRTGIQSKYFSLLINEKCEFLLTSSFYAFPIQQGSNTFINERKFYSVGEGISRHTTDKMGYFDNYIFLTKSPSYLSGAFLTTFIDNDRKNTLPENLKVRDFAIYKDELWLSTGFHDVIDNKEYMAMKILKLKNNIVEEVKLDNIPEGFDVAAIYANDKNLFLLSEKFGLYQLVGNKLRKLLAINLMENKVQAESFIILDDIIYLTTFENGILQFDLKNSENSVTQIIK